MGFWDRLHEAGATELAPGATRRERDRAGLCTAGAAVGLFLGLGCLGFGLLGLTAGRHQEAARTAITAAQALERAGPADAAKVVTIEGTLVTDAPVRLPHSGDLLAGHVRITWRSRDSEKEVEAFRMTKVAALIAIESGGAKIAVPSGSDTLPLRDLTSPERARLVEVEHVGSRTSRTAIAFTYGGSRYTVDRKTFADERVGVEVEARELPPNVDAVVTGQVLPGQLAGDRPPGPTGASAPWMGRADGTRLKIELGTLAEISKRKSGAAGGMVAFGIIALGGAFWAWRRASRIRAGWAARAA